MSYRRLGMLKEYTKYKNENEKAALYYNVVYQTQARNAHPELFGDSVWHNSFYRRLRDGEESLKQKGILDRNLNPTDLAYQTLSSEILKDMMKKLREELMSLATRIKEMETETNELTAKCRELQKMEKYKMVNEVIDKFSFLGIDENWVAVLICSNVVEQAMKKKLEELDIKIRRTPPPSFNDLKQALGNALKEKEGRVLDVLFEPKELWRIRSKIDHWGYRLKFDREKAQAIFVMVREIIDEIWR